MSGMGTTRYIAKCNQGPLDPGVLEFAPDALAAKLEALHQAAREVFRHELATSAPLPPMAEQYYRLALAALEQAGSFARLADYNLSRGD
jgi:hypothetical protein